MRAFLTGFGALSLIMLGPQFACAQASAQAPTNLVENAQPSEWRVSSMRDASVFDRDSNEIGKATDLLVTDAGRITAVIVDISSITRQTGSAVAIPFDQVQISQTGTANAEDLGRGGDAPDHPAAPKLSGGDGSSAAGAVDEARKSPRRLTINLSREQILAAKRYH